jgi:hypothetical protein
VSASLCECGHDEDSHWTCYGGGHECLACMRGEPRVRDVVEEVAIMMACYPCTNENWWDHPEVDRSAWRKLARAVIARVGRAA